VKVRTRPVRREPAASSRWRERLRPPLERLYRDFDYAARVDHDAIRFPLRYHDPRDRELVALLTACLAYGRVDLFGAALDGVLAAMGPSPFAFVRDFDARRDADRFTGFIYRFNRPRDVVAFCLAAREILARHGTLEKCFRAGDPDPSAPIGLALERFARAFLEADLAPSLSAAVGGGPVQAASPLPPLDGAPRAAGLRALDIGVAVAPADPGGHARREHEPRHRAHASPLAQLENGRGDHRAARRDRSG
jgi:hypothetical protein